jgi:hypothetical protein
MSCSEASHYCSYLTFFLGIVRLFIYSKKRMYITAFKINRMHVSLFCIMIDCVNTYKLSTSDKEKASFEYKKSGNRCHVVGTSVNCFHNHFSLPLLDYSHSWQKKVVGQILEMLAQDRREIFPYVHSRKIMDKLALTRSCSWYSFFLYPFAFLRTQPLIIWCNQVPMNVSNALLLLTH